MAVAVLNFPTRRPLLSWLRERGALRRFIAIRGMEELGSQMMNVAIAWHVYSVTHSAMSLAYIGLARFVPNLGMTLVAGQAADRFEKRWIIGLSLGCQATSIAMLALFFRSANFSAMAVYPLLLVVGVAQAFSFPAMSSLQPQLVSPEEFPRAVAVSSSVFQLCSLAGPALGGLIYAASGSGAMALCAGLYLIALTQVRGMKGAHGAMASERGTAETGALAGIRYLRSNRLLLSLISLDLFAVLLGGVTALLPIYAKDILRVGPGDLGLLRCAPGVGAAVVGLVLARNSIERRAGRLMLSCVAGFGLATVIFAISRSFWLSIAALAVAGGFDMVSMVIRQTLVQLATPETMRGRVSAVQWVFIGASSELGEFESGATAALLGTVPAALLGGLATLAVVVLWAKIFPELRRADRLVA